MPQGQMLSPGQIPPSLLAALRQYPTHLSQYGYLTQQRETAPMDPLLRNLQHVAFTRMLMEQYGPVWGRLMALGAIPAWQGAKVVSQNIPGGAQVSQRLPTDLQPHRGTPPSLNQLLLGLQPVFQRLPAPYGR